MPRPLSKTLADALPSIESILPPAAPGLSTRQIHAKLDHVTLVPKSLRLALDHLEREGRARSELTNTRAGGVIATRLYWRADAAP